MAVAHSAASESHTGATGSASQAAFSWTHTQTGTPQGVVVFVSTYASVTSLVTSVTYGGVALTRLTGGAAQDAAGELGRLDTFFLGSGLGTGNQTITVNRTNNATVMYAAAATVTAGANTAVPEQTIVLLQGDGTLAAQTVNDTSPGQNSVRYAGCYSGLNAPPTAGTGSTLLNSIDIGNYGSALVRETTAGQGARSIGFTGATDDRAAVHLAIRELVPRSLPQTVASFTLTGNNATFTKASPKAIAAETGAFTLTGNPADLLHGPDLLAEVGAFVLNGNPADTRHNVRLEAGTGAFTLAGQPATLSKAAAAKVITADRGTFTLASNGATLRQNYAITAEAGTFTVAGQPATLRHNPRISITVSSFALNGGNPALLQGYYLSGGTGTFTETGQPATFRRTWAIQAGRGLFTFTGNPVALTELGAYEIDPILGTFTLSGQPATLAHSQSMSITVGTFTFTGQPAALRQNAALTADRGLFTLTGNPATLTKPSAKQLPAVTGTFSLTGQPAVFTPNSIAFVDRGQFTLTGQPATFARTRQIAGARGQFLLTGNPATLTKSVLVFYSLTPDTGNYLLTGAPTTFNYEQRRRVILIF